MASVIEAVQDTVTGTGPWVKMFVLAIPVYLSYVFYTANNMPLFLAVVIPTALLLLAFMSLIFYNIRNCTNIPFPSLNPIPVFSIIFKGMFALAPLAIILVTSGVLLSGINILAEFPEFQIVYQIIIWTVISSILLTQFMVFSATGSIAQSYNFALISKYCIDVLIGVLFMLIKYAFINFIFVGFVYYVFFAFGWVESPVLKMIYAYFLVINLCSMSNYLAQVYYEAVPTEDKDSILN